MKLIYLTNIPAPYRIKRFNAMLSIFNEEGIDFEVWFMAENEKGRIWEIDYSSIKFKYRIWAGIHPTIGGLYAHFNPGLLYALSKECYDIIVVAGMASPTTWFAKSFIHRDAVKIMSVETNLLGNTTKTGIKKRIKHFLLNHYDAYQVTGTLQIDYVNYFCSDNAHAQYITLPNLIDNSVFRTDGECADLSQYGIDKTNLVCVLPHRILDYKIPMEFIKATHSAERTQFVIIGQGDKRYEERIKAEISSSNLPIIIIPFAQQIEMAALYRAADYFCLPSKTDASPLTPIEAIASGLPIIVSNRIGNKPDVLQEGINGFSFDPYSVESCIDAIKKIEHATSQELKNMGNSSLHRYRETFDNETCLRRYAKAIKRIVEQKRIK